MARTQVSKEIESGLRRLAQGDHQALETAIGIREVHRERTGLDPKTFALVKIAALIGVEAPPASYVWQIGNALSGGVMPDDILGTLHAVVPQVGLPRATAGARGCMMAMGMAASEADLVRAQRDM